MTKFTEKQHAIILRKEGFSYNEIREKVTVSKSTLSLWLRSVGLAKRHQRRITEKQRASQRVAVEKWHNFRVQKTLQIKGKAQSEIKRLSKRERWLIGTALYWAEGTKERQHGSRVIFSNSDPTMIIFFREWVLDFLKVDPADFDYSLYIHEKSKNIHHAMLFWSNLLHVEPHEISIILKKHNPSPKRKNTGVNYKGLVRLAVRKSIDMNRKISGWIEGITALQEIIGE